MSRSQRILLHTLGCRLNEAELEEWAQQFQARGFLIADGTDGADLVVINTCAVTQEAVRKSRKLLRRCQRDNPQARLVVSGCLASLENDALTREQGVDLVVTNRDKDRLVEIVSDTLSLPLMPESATGEGAEALFARGRQRAFIKVQDGCRYQCTFCITTRARGEERSRPVARVIEVINRLHSAGIHEIALTGVQLGGYRHDGQDIGDLLAAILADTDIPRIRLGSLEPWGLPENFWELFGNPRLLPHLHLPLQSGSNEVLRRMARRCKREDFAELVAAGRTVAPRLNVTTDIIVGFPGETDEDWSQTLEMAERMRFGHIHIFAYSPRAGTLAADYPDAVPAEVKRQRSQELQQLAQRLHREVLEQQVGQEVEVLCERIPEAGETSAPLGYTPNYLPVMLTGSPALARTNRILGMTLDEVDPTGEHLRGRITRVVTD